MELLKLLLGIRGLGVSNPKVTPLFLAAGHGLQEALVQYNAKVVGIFSP